MLTHAYTQAHTHTYIYMAIPVCDEAARSCDHGRGPLDHSNLLLAHNRAHFSNVLGHCESLDE